MKTKAPLRYAQAGEKALVEPTPENALEPLLKRPPSSHETVAPGSSSSASAPVNGIVLGVLRHLDENGFAYIDADCLKIKNTRAAALVQLQMQDAGRQVALAFEGGNLQRPIILGLMFSAPALQVSSKQPLAIEQNDTRTVIEGSEELELRCGEAVILLQADGRIQLRGQYITSHASAGQRIRGGSVQIN